MSKQKFNKLLLFLAILTALGPSFLIILNRSIPSGNYFESSNEKVNYYETVCFNKPDVLNKITDKNKEIFYSNRDIYLSKNISNLFCLGNVVEIKNYEDRIDLFIATNPKVNQLQYILWGVVLVLFCYLKIKNKLSLLIFLIPIIYLSIFFISYQKFSYYVFTSTFLLVIFLVLFGMKISDKENYQKFKSKYENLIIKSENKTFVIEINQKPKYFKYTNILVFITFLLLGVLKKLILLDKKEIYNDVLIVIYTSAKMFYFDMNAFNATLNHHSPLIKIVFKYFFYLFDFESFEKVYGVIIFLYSIFGFILMFYLVDLIIQNKTITFLFSSFTFVFLLNSNVLNRDIGLIIFLILLINLKKYLSNQRIVNLVLIIFFSTLQIYNLESYGLSIIFLNLFIITNAVEKLKVLKNYLLLTPISILIIYSKLIVNGQIDTLFKTNYLFHIRNINRNFNSSILNAIGYSPSGTLNFKHVVFTIIVFTFFYIFKNYKFQDHKFLFFLYGWFFIEILSLKIAGPRFYNYGLNLILPSVLIILSLFRLYSFKKLTLFHKYVLIFLFSFLYFFQSFLILIDFSEKNIQASYNSGYDDSNIEKYLENEDTKPKLILAWIHPGDWNLIYSQSNFLPATKYWWWFFMKYFQNEYYIWDTDWNLELVETEFLDNVFKEKPSMAILNKNIDKPPLFFAKVLEDRYQIIYEDEKFIIYKIK